MNQEIISMMKSRVDELTNEEIVIVRDYCNLKLDNSKHGSIGAEMVKRMIAMQEGTRK